MQSKLNFYYLILKQLHFFKKYINVKIELITYRKLINMCLNVLTALHVCLQIWH